MVSKDEISLNVSPLAEGEDYNGTLFTVSFPSGSTANMFKVTILNNEAFEPNEKFSLTLEIPQETEDYNILKGDPFVASVIIEDDESEHLLVALHTFTPGPPIEAATIYPLQCIICFSRCCEFKFHFLLM